MTRCKGCELPKPAPPPPPEPPYQCRVKCRVDGRKLTGWFESPVQNYAQCETYREWITNVVRGEYLGGWVVCFVDMQ